jgi:hypothetical protein
MSRRAGGGAEPNSQAGRETLAWMLLGVHTERLGYDHRDVEQDDRL